MYDDTAVPSITRWPYSGQGLWNASFTVFHDISTKVTSDMLQYIGHTEL